MENLLDSQNKYKIWGETPLLLSAARVNNRGSLRPLTRPWLFKSLSLRFEVIVPETFNLANSHCTGQ